MYKSSEILKDELFDLKKSVNHLWKIGNLLSTTCPAASRFHLFNLERQLIYKPYLLKQDTERSFLFCNHCGNLWAPGNHRVRIKAPARPNLHIKKLLKWEREKPWKLNGQQRRKLRCFRKSTSHVVYSCFHCKKKTKFSRVTKQDTLCSYPVKENRIRNVHSSRHLPKIKYKKDLNAGLFISTPNKESANDLEDNDPTTSCVTPSSFNTTTKVRTEPPLSKILSVNKKAPGGSRHSSFSKNNFIHTPSTVMTTKKLKESHTASKKKEKHLMHLISRNCRQRTGKQEEK